MWCLRHLEGRSCASPPSRCTDTRRHVQARTHTMHTMQAGAYARARACPHSVTHSCVHNAHTHAQCTSRTHTRTCIQHPAPPPRVSLARLPCPGRPGSLADTRAPCPGPAGSRRDTTRGRRSPAAQGRCSPHRPFLWLWGTGLPRHTFSLNCGVRTRQLHRQVLIYSLDEVVIDTANGHLALLC